MNPCHKAGVPARCKLMFSNINDLHRKLDELAVAVFHFDIVFCCETKTTGQCLAADLCLPGYCAPRRLPWGSRPNGL